MLCAYVALYWYHRPEDVTIYGDFDTGYIVTPSLPPGQVAPADARCQPPSDELHERLSHREELLAQAQHRIARTIRERLYRLNRRR